MTNRSLLGSGNGKRNNRVNVINKFLCSSKTLNQTLAIIVCIICSSGITPAEQIIDEKPKNELEVNIQKLTQERGCRGCNLKGAVLNGLNLKEVDLSYANLNFARLNLATLRGANLQKASLLGTSFNGADVSEVDFRGADTTGASFLGAYTLDALFGDLPEEESSVPPTLESTAENTAEPDERITSEPISAPGPKKLEFISPAIVD